MFIENKYKKWYFNICNDAKSKNRKKSSGEYYENHHIIPRSLGGDNQSSNLVLLTPREHFLCHLLLIKFTEGCFKIKMQNALSFFTSRSLTGRNHQIACTNNSIAKMGENNPMFGKTPWNKGKSGYMSDESIEEIRKGHRAWVESGGITDDYRKKISNSLKGRKKPEGFGEKLSDSISGENHHSFKGYYCTPFGKFPNSTSIEDLIPNQLVRRWCKNPDKVITKNSYLQVEYLKSLGETVIGKTFREIGFYYEPL